MRIFSNKWFSRFARKEGIKDLDLCKAIRDARAGMIDADLGGNVIKMRIARPDAGKSGGYRSIVLFRSGDKAFFVYGFAKNSRGNIRKDELEGFRELADELFGYDTATLTSALKSGALTELICDEQKISE